MKLLQEMQFKLAFMAILPVTFLIGLTILLSTPLSAANFNLSLTIGTSTVNKGFVKAEEVIDALKTQNLVTYFPSYAGNEAVSINLDFRGLPMSLSYPSGSNNLVLSIPSLSIEQTFSGTSRDDSNRSFKDWLKKDGTSTLNAIMKKLVELSPNDPLAGNPTSLMGQMVANDFSQTFNPVHGIPKEGGSSANLLGFGIKAQTLEDSGKKGKTFTIPVSYLVRMDFDPRHQLSFYLPLTYIEYEKAKSYNVGLGMAYRIPLTENWSLTPGLGTGVVGSIDLGSAGQLISGSLTSHLLFQLPSQMKLSMANMVGNYQSLKIKIKDYESDPGISNFVFRNGLLLSIPHTLFSYNVESELFIIDTRFTGDKLYMNSYQEIGLSFGSDKSATDLNQYLRMGLSYLTSSKSKGFSVNFGYSF